MLAIMIYLSLKGFGINLVDSKTYPTVNENPEIRVVEIGNCQMIKGPDSSVFFGMVSVTNNKYMCK